MTSPTRATYLLERLYAAGDIAAAQVLQVAIGVARGGTPESGGAIRSTGERPTAPFPHGTRAAPVAHRFGRPLAGREQGREVGPHPLPRALGTTTGQRIAAATNEGRLTDLAESPGLV